MSVLSRGTRRGEHGSLPLALLTVIIVAGIAVVLVARIVATQNQVRFDQGFHASLPVADAGVNLAKFWLNNETELEAAPGTDIDGEDCIDLTAPDPGFYEPAKFPIGCMTIEYDREIDGNEYWFTLTREGEREWVVDSTGVDARSGEQRRAVSAITERPLVEVALFANVFVNFGGGNSADSYNSDNGTWCTGHGIISTNGDMDTSGTSGSPCHTQHGLNRTVDRVQLHNVKDAPVYNATETEPAGDRCEHSGGGGGANCREVSEEDPEYLAPELFDEPLELSLEHNVTFIQHALDACEAQSTITPMYETSEVMSDGVGVLQREGFVPDFDQDNLDRFEFPGDVDGPYRCFDNFIFDVDTEIDASTDEPVILVVRNFLSVQGGGQNSATHVGCVTSGSSRCVAGPGAGASSPEAARLWIFVADEAEVDIGNHSAFAGVIWGPGAECDGGAQARIFGSLICGSLPQNLGSWKFHYDEALGGVSSGEFYRSAWREEFVN